MQSTKLNFRIVNCNGNICELFRHTSTLFWGKWFSIWIANMDTEIQFGFNKRNAKQDVQFVYTAKK